MRSSLSRLLVAVASGSILALTTQAAFAFCRTTTCDLCVQPAGGCVSEGLKLAWATDCVSYDVQQAASTQVSLDAATSTVREAFSHWTEATCSTGAHPAIELLDRGPVKCGRVEYNDPNAPDAARIGGNSNLIVFRDTDWGEAKAADPTSTLALTTVTFSRNTGEILDADIEINSTKPISVGEVSPDAYDLESILTHEIGHFLGLAHSREPCAGADCPTMTAAYTKGSDAFRTLESDDIAGICTIYPLGRTATTTACTPMYGFSTECGIPKPNASGCAVARGGIGSRGAARPWILVVGAWAGVVALGGRMRGRRHKRSGHTTTAR